MENSVALQLNDQLWREYRTKLHHFILNRVNDPGLAEDIVQEVLTKVYHRLDTLKDPEKIIAWMYQITRNMIVDYYRKRSPTEELDEALIVQEVNIGEDVRKDLAGCLMPLINELPVHYRQAIMLSEIDGLTQKEVALKQGLTLSGAKSRVQRGRQLLKTMLLECCRIELDQRGTVINYEPKKRCSNC